MHEAASPHKLEEEKDCRKPALVKSFKSTVDKKNLYAVQKQRELIEQQYFTPCHNSYAGVVCLGLTGQRRAAPTTLLSCA